MEYRVDELARAAGTTVRNVRAYQDRGLLPPPRRMGRVGLYSESHLARLRLIGHLLGRGFSLQNISELVAGWERGHELSDVLGLEVALASPFSDEVPGYISAGELAAAFDGANDDTLNQALDLGLIESEPDGDGTRYRVPSPRMLHAGAELVRAGVPLPEVLAHARALRDDVDRIAGRFVELVAAHVFGDFDDGVPPPGQMDEMAQVVQRLRPLAEMVVDAELARALEHHAQEQLGERLAALLAARAAEGRTATAS